MTLWAEPDTRLEQHEGRMGRVERSGGRQERDEDGWEQEAEQERNAVGRLVMGRLERAEVRLE